MPFAWPLLLWLSAAAADWTRLLPPGQAQTPDEFDAYLRVVQAASPAEVVSTASVFQAAWPRSELAVQALVLQMDAYRALGRADEAIGAGERALRLSPQGLPFVLVTLAHLLPGRDPALAAEYARRALRLVAAFRLPRSLPPAEWALLKRTLESQAHAALGLAAVKSDRLAQAVAEFETAVALAPAPDASQIYRLARLYREQRRFADARRLYRQAIALDQPHIRQLALRDLAALPE
jgi:tetratricopeptide (TPR) repeat protein